MAEEGGPLILLVEDDDETRNWLVRYLQGAGFATEGLASAERVDQIIEEKEVRLVVLDRMLPREDGLDVARRLHRKGVPVIILTALSEDIERIVGLEVGADDYLGKPFNPRELVARIRAVLRRGELAGQPVPSSRYYCFAGYRVDTLHRRVHDPEGVRVFLTGAEYDLLVALCLRPGISIGREELVELTRGANGISPGRSIDILISRLRHKLEQDPRDPKIIITRRLSGYMFTPQVTTE